MATIATTNHATNRNPANLTNPTKPNPKPQFFTTFAQITYRSQQMTLNIKDATISYVLNADSTRQRQ